MLDAREVLEEYKGVFVNQGVLFISTHKDRFLTGYVNCEVLFPHFDVMWDIVDQLVSPFLGEVDVFMCPSTGDIVQIQYATIIANERGHSTKAVWADKQSDGSYRVDRRGFAEVLPGARVLVINDRISQGGTTTAVIEEARRCGGEVIGVSSISAVSKVTAEFFGVPRYQTLAAIDVDSFDQGSLPDQYRDWPVVVDEPLGHGHEWAKHNTHPGNFIKLLES